jgi:hypothetical protein
MKIATEANVRSRPRESELGPGGNNSKGRRMVSTG